MSQTMSVPAFSPILPVTHGAPLPATPVNGLPPAAMQDLVHLFKLLADESRLKILNHLTQSEELNVRTLCTLLDQTQPSVSHHLALLKEAGLIECRRDGKHNFYKLVRRRCQAYLDSIFGVADGEVRRLRVENAVLSYGHDDPAAKSG
jgi:ArsR family transcriptional regulator, arsenate/arsenite/antimonite-responsive transcriptional repressor